MDDVLLVNVVAVGLETVRVLEIVVWPPEDVSTLVPSSAPVRIPVFVESVTPVSMLVAD